MSLKASPIEPVPGETARVARAAFRRGNPHLELRDEPFGLRGRGRRGAVLWPGLA